jgi:hypothetical protein
MKHVFDLAKITSGQQKPLALFAVTSLGIVDSLAAGSLTPTQAIRAFFHGKNIQYTKKKLNDERANEIMGREFQHELQAIKALCYEVLEGERAVA